MSSEQTASTGDLTAAQLKAAREAGPQMLDILAGWLVAEHTLCGTGSFRDKLKAAKDLRGLHGSAEALVVRVMNAEATSTE